MQFDILTLFPDLIHSYAGESILGRGQKNKAISIRAHNFRDFTKDKQRHVDDKPYGGDKSFVGLFS
jgi:tRNA (guanine37-N1)-methyltransferase